MNTSRFLTLVGVAALALACGKDKQQSSAVAGVGGSTTAASNMAAGTAGNSNTPTNVAAGAGTNSNASGGVATTNAAGNASTGTTTSAVGPTATGGQGTQGSTAATIADCGQLADQACSTMASCAPAYLALAFGTQSQCAAAVSGACDHFSSLGRPLDFQGCANALNAPHCQAILTNPYLPKVCLMPRGANAAGAACGADSDCQSLLCNKKGATCGTCTARGARGASCTAPGECEPGLLCDGSKCVDTVGAGDPCDATVPLCSADTTCVNSTCQALGTAGATCNALTTNTCASAQGFVCASGTCAQMTILNEGQSCLNPEQTCNGMLYCTGTATAKTCVARASLGQDCSVAPCLLSLNCVNGLCSYEELNTCTGS
jgi:hypothetical protein